MITNKNPRRYEVSLWTLQDSFITVLKSFDTDNLGCIQEPQMKLSDDAEDTFFFKLPMYIMRDGAPVENPIWYNVTEGNLIVNLRKIKVIFHKGEPQQRVFEFVITKVEESHEGFEKYCEIECEGLAYNELGKTGYNIELSQDVYEIDCEQGVDCTETCVVQSKKGDNGETIYYITPSNQSELITDVIIGDIRCTNIEVDNITYVNTVILPSGLPRSGEVEVSYHYQPLNNISYWLDKVFSSQSKWTYRINMDWRDYPEDTRQSTKVYEDAYVENWELNEEGLLTPSASVESKEKFRIVEGQGSNRYNLTQTIAETFGVFCRYIYSYDDNFYITGRTVEFYNSTLKEQEEILDFTYYYQTEDLSREMDSADQISKMFVLSGSDEEMLNNSITEVEGNKSLEDYLLNFDYLYEIGAIDDDQYDYIEEFETVMRDYNEQLQNLATKRTIYEEALTEFEVKRDSANLAAANALEAMEDERAYIKHLLNSDKTDYDGEPETLSVTGINPYYGTIVNEESVKTCEITHQGVFPNTIIVFTSIANAQEFHNSIYGAKAAYSIETREEGGNTSYSVNGTEYSTLALATKAAKQLALESLGGDKYLSTDNYQVVIDEDSGFATGLTNIKCDDTQTALFLAFDYSLDLYHKILAEDWASVYIEQTGACENYSIIVEKIDGARDENGEWIDDDHGLLQKCIDEYNRVLQDKRAAISEFEDYMGPALREGTWQPDDDYARYSNNKTIQLDLGASTGFNDDEASIGWDKNLFDGEDSNYYKYGIKQEEVYYPCIKLTANLINKLNKAIVDPTKEEQLNFYDFGYVWDDTVVPGINPLIVPAGNQPVKLDYPQIFRIGSEAEIGFIQRKDGDKTIIPVLFLTNADSYCSAYHLLNQPQASQTDILKSLNGKIGHLTTKEVQREGGLTGDIEISYVVEPLDVPAEWIANGDLQKYNRVYPRIKINNTKFVNNTEDCILYINGGKLSPYSDYTVTSRYDVDGITISTDIDYWLENDDINEGEYSYYINIKPEALIRNYQENLGYGKYRLFYKLSNTGLAIYLDAVEVLKENSVPKVTYNITPMVFNTDFIETAYDRIHQIIHINDPELKFENVQGYISGLELNLDEPWEDSIEVQNYTTKFEDLFSSIVASTESIKKNAAVISSMSQAFVSTGEITEKTLQRSMNLADVTLKYNNDNFIIGDSGIKAYSDAGIVQYSNQGIFTASKKDDNDNWIWNTSILPTGINANAITAGRLDTNLIRIYSGNDLRFQMNGEGLFAYKSWLDEDISQIEEQKDRDKAAAEIVKYNGRDPAQYVVMNSDGLFLTAKEGAQIFNNDAKTAKKLKQDVNRVEISWNGLKLRNNENEETLYADPDTGNLNIKGNLTIESNNVQAELTESKLRFNQYELVRIESNGSECLSFVYNPEASW